MTYNVLEYACGTNARGEVFEMYIMHIVCKKKKLTCMGWDCVGAARISVYTLSPSAPVSVVNKLKFACQYNDVDTLMKGLQRTYAYKSLRSIASLHNNLCI
jgi:hypothetical protein